MAYPGAKLAEGGSGGPPRLAPAGPQPVQTWHIPKTEKETFKNQAALPRLPIPPLEQSLSMYLQSVRPLCTAEEWTRTKGAVTDFLTSPLSAELQNRLRKRAADSADSSWLVDWWNELCYFGYRDPVVVWVSYFYEFTPDTWSGMRQTFRAAAYVKAAFHFRHLLRTETLPAERGAGGVAQDMSMFPYLFNSTRMPHPGKDYYATHDKFYYNHITVLRRGRAYSVEVGAGRTELSIAEIDAQLQAVIAAADAEQDNCPVGALTTDNRDSWAANRERLSAHSEGNRLALHEIDTSTLVVCLDDVAPQGAEARCRNLWHGDGKNRWFDKPLQFVVCRDGSAGVVGEHGIMDGQPTNSTADWILTRLATKGTKSVDTPNTGAALAAPKRLSFTLPQADAIPKALTAFNTLIGSQEMKVLNWTKFGKNGIKKMKVSPDAFCQMAMQLAHKRINGTFAATYEACSTRMYLHGRTETVRSCHVPGAAFVDAMDARGTSAKAKYALLKKAAEHQSWYTKRAIQAQGCDRHLMGLSLLCKDNEKPDIFQDPVYGRSKSWVLSTSALASEHFASWGFGEVVPNGYGLGYLVNRENLVFTCSTLTTHPVPARVMIKALEGALADMSAMCAEAQAAPAKL